MFLKTRFQTDDFKRLLYLLPTEENISFPHQNNDDDDDDDDDDGKVKPLPYSEEAKEKNGPYLQTTSLALIQGITIETASLAYCTIDIKA